MSCERIQFNSPKICAADLRHKIYIKTRTLVPSSTDSVDFTEAVATYKTVWAAIKTWRGVSIFNTSNFPSPGTDAYTHNIYIRYIPNLTQEYWIEYANKYYDIKNIININEENKYLQLQCVERGTTSSVVNIG